MSGEDAYSGSADVLARLDGRGLSSAPCLLRVGVFGDDVVGVVRALRLREFIVGDDVQGGKVVTISVESLCDQRDNAPVAHPPYHLRFYKLSLSIRSFMIASTTSKLWNALSHRSMRTYYMFYSSRFTLRGFLVSNGI